MPVTSAARHPRADQLAASYLRCRQLHRRHGRTYFLATRLLPRWKRPHVHALYGFARFADEIVDRTRDHTPAERERLLGDWSDRFMAGLHGEPVDDPLLPAVLHTIAVFDLDRADFGAFLRSMAMDLTVTGYADHDALTGYMDGSAAVIGTMMLPILGPADPAAAREPARSLGFAFQLTNFIRDVAEDLDRGRIYLPQADLDGHGVTRDMLARAAARRESTPQLRELIRHEISLARRHYAAAAPGIAMLSPDARPCIRAAFHVYGAILDEIERSGHDVFTRRATVPVRRRLDLMTRSLLAPRTLPAIAAAGGAR